MIKQSDFIPSHLIGQFDTLQEAAKALQIWKNENRGPGRPKTRDSRITVGTLKKMLKHS